TALDGLPMATRPGRLDAGVVLYLMQGLGMDEAAITRLLYHESGLHGVSGLTGDMRELLASADPMARLAVDLFVHRIAQETAALAVTLGGLDGFVFTAGIGENAPAVRAAVIARLGPFAAGLAVHVIPTDEEMMIARHTLALLQGRQE
ncbi:MAG: acetate/propionate family kinase, partial [Acetobacteraceae bacterium]